jgi:FKBP-type peptidyl-prolyl cis-trans isomerase
MSKNFIVTALVGIVALIFFAYLIFVFGAFSSPPETPAQNTTADSTTRQATTSQTNSTASKAPEGELKIEDITVGDGQEVKSGDTVEINYTGTLTDGTKFDSSYDRGKPFETKIGVGQVIEGWDKGVVGMKVGGKRKLTIPPSMGYGDQSAGSIPPNSTLIFEVELLGIK